MGSRHSVLHPATAAACQGLCTGQGPCKGTPRWALLLQPRRSHHNLFIPLPLFAHMVGRSSPAARHRCLAITPGPQLMCSGAGMRLTGEGWDQCSPLQCLQPALRRSIRESKRPGSRAACTLRRQRLLLGPLCPRSRKTYSKRPGLHVRSTARMHAPVAAVRLHNPRARTLAAEPRAFHSKNARSLCRPAPCTPREQAPRQQSCGPRAWQLARDSPHGQPTPGQFPQPTPTGVLLLFLSLHITNICSWGRPARGTLGEAAGSRAVGTPYHKCMLLPPALQVVLWGGRRRPVCLLLRLHGRRPGALGARQQHSRRGARWRLCLRRVRFINQ